MERDDGVAAVGGGGLEDEVAVGGIHGHDLNGGRVGRGERHARGGGDVDGDAAVLVVGQGGRFLVEADVHVVAALRDRLDGQLQVGDGVHLGAVDGLLAGEVVEAVRVGGLAGDAVVLFVVVPAVAGHIVHPGLCGGIVGGLTDGVVVQLLHNEDAGGDAVAAVVGAARDGVGEGEHAGFRHVEGVVGHNLVKVLAGDVQRVGIDGVAWHDLRLDVQDLDAVAAVHCLHQEDEVCLAVLAAHLDRVNGDLGGIRGGYRGRGRGDGDGHVGVPFVGEGGVAAEETDVQSVGVAVSRVDGELEIRGGVHFGAVDGLLAGELVIAVLIHGQAGDGDAVPFVRSHVVGPGLGGDVEGAVADLVLVRFLDNEVSHDDAVAAVGRAAVDGVGEGEHAGLGDVEGVAGDDFVKVFAGDVHRVGIDGVAFHDITLDMQFDNAVTTVYTCGFE